MERFELVKIWPELTGQGDLPPGVHTASLEDIIERFGTGTAQRLLVGRRLGRIYALAAGTGALRRFVIFGTFITAKPHPNDIDIS